MNKNLRRSLKTYVLDANAVIRFLSQGPDAERVAALIRRVAIGEAQLFISLVNRVEVLYILAKSKGLQQAKKDLRTLAAAVESVPDDESLAEVSAEIRFNYRLGLADCFAAALALRLNATLVTADPDFEKLGKRIRLIRLSRHRL
jgi:uncharacterized protein